MFLAPHLTDALQHAAALRVCNTLRHACAAQGKHAREINLGQLMREEYGERVRRPMGFGGQPYGSPMTGLPHAPML